jgi:acetyl-CoA acetyltransferase
MHHRGVPHEKVNVNGSAMALGHPRGPMAEKLQHAARRERGFLTGD